MAAYSFSDIERMQQEAAKRVENMQAFSRQHIDATPPLSGSDPELESDEIPNQEEQPATDSAESLSPPKKHLLDGEQGILILLILLLAGDEENEMVVLALLYVLL